MEKKVIISAIAAFVVLVTAFVAIQFYLIPKAKASPGSTCTVGDHLSNVGFNMYSNRYYDDDADYYVDSNTHSRMNSVGLTSFLGTSMIIFRTTNCSTAKPNCHLGTNGVMILCTGSSACPGNEGLEICDGWREQWDCIEELNDGGD